MKSLSTLTFSLAAAIVSFQANASAQTIVISDDFESDSSANYTIVDDGTPDGSQSFAFDYVAAGIPLAPRSVAGNTGGLRLSANDSAGLDDAWTLFHNTSVVATRYKLTVDVWSNFAGTTGTTEYAQVGVAGNGVTYNAIYSGSTTGISGSGAYFAFTGDGGAIDDYGWYRDCANTTPADPDCGTLQVTHPSYLGNGRNNFDPFFQALYPSPPSTNAGCPGNIWTTLEIEVDNSTNVISFSLDGALTYQGSYGGTFNGLVNLGLFDRFDSLSGATNFVIYDNLVVETLLTPVGTNYCMANANSTGNTGVISALGSDIAADNNVILSATSLPNFSFGFFLTSQMQGFTMNPGGSSGNLCVSGAIGRYVGPGQIQNSGPAGELELALDLTMHPTPTGFVTVQGGETWNFTTWFRDSDMGTATSNFTDGIEIMFQ